MISRTSLPLLASTTFALAACTLPGGEDVARSDDELRVGIGRPPIIGLAPDVDVARITGMQPGWVRIDVSFANVPADATIELSHACAAGDASAATMRLTRVDRATRRATFDLKTSLDWLDGSTARNACVVTSLTARAVRAGAVLAEKKVTRSFAMDLPLSHMSPERVGSSFAGTTVPLAPAGPSRRYAAYPPQIVGVRSSSGRVAFVEVEEVPARQIVRLRQLVGFDRGGAGNWMVAFELGGGGEIPPGWGIDVDVRGITKVTAPYEESRPGFMKFATGRWSPADMNDKSKKIFPAPPAFDDATYLANVLDNKGVPRAIAPRWQIDVVYNASAHALEATNGAEIGWIEGAPIEGVDPSRLSGVTLIPHLPKLRDLVASGPASAPAFDLVEVGTHEVDTRASQTTSPFGIAASTRVTAIPPGHLDELASLDPAPLAASFAPSMHFAEPIQRAPSPEEIALTNLGTQTLMSGTFGNGGGGGTFPSSCVIAGDKKAFTSPLTTCDGFTGASGCPTIADPVRPESLPAAPGMPTMLSLHSTLTPQLTSRTNWYGTCGTHSQVQHYEAVLNKLHDDLAPGRVIHVDGAPIAIPEPRIALSPAAFLANIRTWAGTELDADVDDGTAKTSTIDEQAQLPMVIESYWPAREPDLVPWTMNSGGTPAGNVALGMCRASFWYAGFCAGQGSAPPGAYRNYARMVHDGGAAADPLRDGMWSLGFTYSKIVSTPIPLTDRDAAIQRVITELRAGLPVRMSYLSSSRPKVDGGAPLPLLTGMSWYLPPELAACDLAETWTLEGGHAVNVVGFVLRGSPSAPDPYRSFFIIQNNWGKTSGYAGYFTINLAAFKKLAFDLRTYRLDRTCASAACARH